jgi:polyphenol oxidase
MLAPSMIHSALLSEISWLDHGFGTRAAPLSQEGMASLKQIHSARVLTANATGLTGEGDALVTDQIGLPVSVRTADCYPVLLVDIAARRVAAVHAGWRGTAAGIVKEALLQMQADPKTVRAAIGPGIGKCCYEVGWDVAQLFGQAVTHSAKCCIDLAAANRQQLLDSGVREEHIEIIGQCTFCDAGKFHSFRRDKDQAGRLISYIGVKS